MEVQERSFGYVISLGKGHFVKTGFGLRCPVRVWKTKKGAEKYIKRSKIITK